MEGKVEAKKTTGHRQERVGTVVSAKMQKTVVVAVERLIRHELYRKTLRRTATFMAHDVHGAKQGDRVRIRETRPLSRAQALGGRRDPRARGSDRLRPPRPHGPSGEEARHDPDANPPPGGRQLRRPEDLLHPAARRLHRALSRGSATSSPPT